MKAIDATVGTKVVRSKGDYVVGRVGPIVEIDAEKGRARVDWNLGGGRTWVKFEALERADIPYRIQPGDYNDKTGRRTNPKYIKL